MNYLKNLILFLLLIFNCSCGTLLNSSNAEIAFNSKPQGISILINDSLYGKTPFLAEISKKRNHEIKYIYKDSIIYRDTIESKIDLKWVLLDVIFPTNIAIVTIPIPFLMDGLSGNNKKLNKSLIYYDLNPKTIDSSNISNPSKPNFGLSENQFIDKFNKKKSSYWNILRKKGKDYQNVKLIKIEKDQLFFAEMEKDDYDENFNLIDKRIIANRQISIDSIKSIVYKKEITGFEIFGNTLKGLGIGIAIGFGGIYGLGEKPYGERAIGPFFIACGTSLLGGILGYSFSTDDYESFDMRKLSLNEKINLINRQILLVE